MYLGNIRIGGCQQEILRHLLEHPKTTRESLKGEMLPDLYTKDGLYRFPKKNLSDFNGLNDFLNYELEYSLAEKKRSKEVSSFNRSMRTLIKNDIVVCIQEYIIIHPAHL